MASDQQYARDSLDDVEGRPESTPLLRQQNENDDDNGHAASERRNWTAYPAQLWAQSQEYVNSLRRKHADRGKQRQQSLQPDESSSSSHANGMQVSDRQNTFGRRLRAQHPHVFLALTALGAMIGAVLVLLVIVILHLVFVTLRAPNDATQQRIMATAFNIDGPDNVEVVGLTDDGLTVKIDGRIGMDADLALDEWLGKPSSVGWWQRKDRAILEWALNKVKGVQVDVDTLALRSPDWSVPREIDRVNLIPDDKKQKKQLDSTAHVERHRELPPLLPADLVTFHIEPLLVPLPPVGAAQSKKLGTIAKPPKANTPIHLTVTLKPSGPALLAFAEHTLANKTAFIDFQVKNARVRGMNAKDWLRGAVSSSSWWSVPGRVNVGIGEQWKRLAQKLPKMDGGGNGTNTDEFLNLTRYDFQEIGGPNDDYPERALGLDIFAEAMNPIGKLLVGHVGYSLPFGAFLPVKDDKDHLAKPGAQPKDVVLLAAVATEPFDIHGEKKIPLRLHGRVIPPPQLSNMRTRDQKALQASGGPKSSSDDPAAVALSDFLSRFLRGDSNTLYVRGGSPFTPPKMQVSSSKAKKDDGKKHTIPMPGGGSDDLPVWLDHLLRVASVPIAFPGSKVTDLIQNVSISDLKITPHPFEHDKLVCSGVIMGVMNMPGQLASVDVQITDLWPDVLIFNGKPPSMKHGGGKHDEEAQKKQAKSRLANIRTKILGRRDDGDDDDGGDDDDTPEPDPLPDPLPEHAFGRVVPHSWAPAETYMDPDDPKGERKLLRSELKNVPFTVLPGRGAEFRSFSWKIVTGEGARAGIEGKAKAKIWNSGLGKLTLSNMPVKGVFMVGKRGSTPGDGDDDGDDGFALG